VAGLPVMRATEGWARTYRRTWRGSVFSSVLTPVLFLLAMGAGVGSLVDRGQGADALGGLDYMTFLAPGLLAASAMQTGAMEAMWPVMARIKWVGTYHAALATPITVTELAVSQLLWVAVRVAITSVISSRGGSSWRCPGPSSRGWRWRHRSPPTPPRPRPTTA
jgi:lipooligosaccharide transport system permease protein